MKFRRLVVFAVLFTGLCAVGQDSGSSTSATASSPSATVPRLVQFGGFAKDAEGKPLTGTIGITFLLYRDETGGAPLWLETQNVQADARGHYSVQLGAATSDGLPADQFTSGEARWLGVQIAGQAEQPRVLLLAVPYALKAADASTIGGLPPSAFVRANPASGDASIAETAAGKAPSGASRNGPLTLQNVQTNGGTTNFLPIWTSSTVIGNSALFQTGGKVGIGTTSPSATLDVKGTALIEQTLNLPQTTSSTVGVVNVNGTPFLHDFFSGRGSPDNVFLGYNAGNFTMTGQNNTAVGTVALHANTSAFQNTAIGMGALGDTTNGGSNTAVGYGALGFNTTGFNNAALGISALLQNTSGQDNTGIGSFAGGFNNGNNNTFVGYDAGTSKTNLTNATAIGASSDVEASNSMVLGTIQGSGTNVGIGTTTPATTLDVKGLNTYQPLLVESPNTFGTWIQLANTSPGGITWYMLSAASGNSEGAGNMAITNSHFNGTGTLFIHSNVHVDGNMFKGGGAFQIDDPLDPANKYLSHSFVESPDMMNIYNGNVTTNKQGLAVVVLPDYFESLNRDFRYQLTPIGQFAQAIVAREISHGRFVIKTNRPGVKVSWQITGIRHDAYADAHRIPVEEVKPLGERGKYLHPELFGESKEKAIGYSVPPSPAAPSEPVAATVATANNGAN